MCPVRPCGLPLPAIRSRRGIVGSVEAAWGCTNADTLNFWLCSPLYSCGHSMMLHHICYFRALAMRIPIQPRSVLRGGPAAGTPGTYTLEVLRKNKKLFSVHNVLQLALDVRSNLCHGKSDFATYACRTPVSCVAQASCLVHLHIFGWGT